MVSLFSESVPKPLADTIRPSEFQDIFGQEHLFDSNSPILRSLKADCMPNIILWGPQDVGKLV